MEDAVSEDGLNIPNIIKRYKAYLKKNRDTVFKDMPRRKKDMRLYEVVYCRRLGLEEIVLLVFVELKEEEVKELEQEIQREGVRVIVIPIAVLHS